MKTTLWVGLIGIAALAGCTESESVKCGEGTVREGDTCIPAGEGSIECGAGTHAVDGVCLPDDDGAALECGTGTHEVDGFCVADDVGGGLVCGDGTHAADGICVPDGGARYELRAAIAEVPADGHSPLPLLVIGTNEDGTPSTADVVLGASRAGAGTFAPSTLTLGTLGGTPTFTPCNYTTDGCTGPLTLTVALASDPSTVVATLDVELVEPTGVGSLAPCLGGGNVMYFNGNDYIYNGILTVSEGTFNAYGYDNSVTVDITPSGQDQGLWWYLVFNTTQLGTPLEPGIYEMAERAAFASPGHPGMDVSGDGRGCNTITGRFQVHDYTRTGTDVQSLAITFEQHCEGGTNVLNGCINLEP